MNANELADVLEDLHEQDKIDGVAHLAMPEAADMLRQQQAEIEALKKQLDQATILGSAYAIRAGVAEGQTNTAIHDAILDIKGK